MPDKLKETIDAYREAVAQLSTAISNPGFFTPDMIRQCDRELSDIFDTIVEMEPGQEQLFVRINFILGLIETNFLFDDRYGAKLVSVIRADVKKLHKLANGPRLASNRKPPEDP